MHGTFRNSCLNLGYFEVESHTHADEKVRIFFYDRRDGQTEIRASRPCTYIFFLAAAAVIYHVRLHPAAQSNSVTE